ncbi:MAG: hypothetical protein AAGL98_13670, partial [Planctomycetota bacterium]
MSGSIYPPGNPVVSRRLIERITALGFPLLRVGADGRAKTTVPCSWFERTVAESPDLGRAMKSILDEHAQDVPDLLEPIGGVYLVVLNTPSGEASGYRERALGRHVVLMLSQAFLDGDPLRRLCDRAQLDWRATRSRAETQRFVTANEAKRIAAAIRWLDDDDAARREQRKELHSLGEELSNNYEELSLIYTLANSMALDQPAESFFAEACNELQEVSDLNWVGLQIISSQPRLKTLQGQSFVAGSPGDTAAPKQLGPKLLDLYGDSTKPVIIDDTEGLCPEISNRDKSLLVVPLRRNNGLLGVLFGGGRRDGQHLTSIDAKLCASIGNNLAIFLENY